MRTELRRIGAAVAIGSLLLLLPGCGEGGEESAGDGASVEARGDADLAEMTLGEVDFPTSCAPDTGPTFERSVALLHSFYFGEAREGFESVLDEDPECAMAHWGLAMVARNNPFAGSPGRAGDEAGLEAAERALELEPPTDREQGYVEAVLALFRDHDSVDYRTRGLRYEEAMDRLRSEHPDDDEATIFYAREVTANASPTDDSFERQLRATELMEPLFDRYPRHPGLAHYIIHAYDAPPLAERGLEAAQAYAEIAPSAPHALHMPSHIFTRMGYWDESIETNRRSAEAAGPESGARLHAWDYMVYGHIQEGELEAADSVAAESNDLIARAGLEGRLPYNAAAMEARAVLERDRWKEAMALEVRAAPGTPPEAVTRFARGLGAARSGEVTLAAEEVAALARIRDTLRDEGEDDWAERTEAQRFAVAAWIALARGEDAEAMDVAERAAAIEERVEKHPVTPGPLLPARELQGDLLMELGRTDEAAAAYRATLEREPNRARAEAGLARAEGGGA